MMIALPGIIYYSQQKQIVANANKLESAITKIINDNRGPQHGTQYGYMYYNHDVDNFTKYKVYETGDMQHVAADLTHQILHCVKNKISAKFLFYQTQNIRPDLVSYRYVVSNLLHVKFKLSRFSSKSIYRSYGNIGLYRDLYRYLKFKQEFDSTNRYIMSLSEEKLSDAYHDVYNCYPDFIYNKQKRTIKSLIRANKSTIVKKYLTVAN